MTVADVTVFEAQPDAHGVGGVWHRIPLPDGVDVAGADPDAIYTLVSGVADYSRPPAPLPAALAGDARYLTTLAIVASASVWTLRVHLATTADDPGDSAGDDIPNVADLALALRTAAHVAVVPLAGDPVEPYEFPLTGDVAAAVTALVTPLADDDPIEAVLLDRSATSPVTFRGADEAPIANRLPAVPMSRDSAMAARPRLVRATFGDGYVQVTPDGLHATDRTFDAQWDAAPLDDLYRLARFFEARRGVEPFAFTAAGDRARAWRCEEWRGPRRLGATHGTLQARLVEHHPW